MRFSIEQSYRGVEGVEVELIDEISICEYQFEKGKSYLVYAYRNPGDHTPGTSGCSRTTEISHASDDLAYVRELSEGKARQYVSGIVVEDRYKPLPGIKVILAGAGERRNTVTDRKGRFSIILSRQGNYKVRLILPRRSGVFGTSEQVKYITKHQVNARNTVVDYELEIDVGRCAFLDVWVAIEKKAGN